VRIKLTYGSTASWFEFPDDAMVDVAALLGAVQQAQPDVYLQWCDGEGQLRHSLSVFVNGDHVRYHSGLQTELKDGDEVVVIALIAGG